MVGGWWRTKLERCERDVLQFVGAEDLKWLPLCVGAFRTKDGKQCVRLVSTDGWSGGKQFSKIGCDGVQSKIGRCE